MRADKKRESDRWGWWPAVTLVFLFSSVPAWTLDLEAEIARRQADASAISKTLGRDRKAAYKVRIERKEIPNEELPSLEFDPDDDYKVELISKK